jgi:hypothetical protein
LSEIENRWNDMDEIWYAVGATASFYIILGSYHLTIRRCITNGVEKIKGKVVPSAKLSISPGGVLRRYCPRKWLNTFDSEATRGANPIFPRPGCSELTW